jgi:hypothetical protein
MCWTALAREIHGTQKKPRDLTASMRCPVRSRGFIAFDARIACAFVRGHNHHRNPQVTKLREYLLIADDGQLALGTHSAMPAEPYPGASATAQYYSNEAVDRECIALKQRSLLRLLDPSSNVTHHARLASARAVRSCPRLSPPFGQSSAS